MVFLSDSLSLLSLHLTRSINFLDFLFYRALKRVVQDISRNTGSVHSGQKICP